MSIPIGRRGGNGGLSTTDVEVVINSVTGWAQYADTILTVGSPQIITEGQSVVLANNAGSSITSQIPVGVSSFYNPTTKKITPENSGDSYMIRVNFDAFTSSVSGLATLELDIGGTQNIILRRGFTFPKGTGASNGISISSSNLIFAGDTFLANGGDIKIRSEVGTTSIYNITYLIDRMHKGR